MFVASNRRGNGGRTWEDVDEARRRTGIVSLSLCVCVSGGRNRPTDQQSEEDFD